ncbi:hypothetical protein F5I97DRAFT_1879460 [Phlebopus sp. FC_14]|nr:hypothetical protein F5I97DRAFT_1879460 [Phlebopus sp. FC_14]
MSSNSTTSTSQLLPPPGMNFLVVIDEALPFLMIGSTMGAVLFAMLLALFFFSTPSLRVKPIFILNVIVILLGLVGATFNIYMEIQTLGMPGMSLPYQTILTMSTINDITPLLVDCILLLRLAAVFPRHQTPPFIWLVIMGIPVLVKVGRAANFVFFLVYEIRDINNLVKSKNGVGSASILLTVLPNVKIEWILQVFDDLFSSGLFLWRIYRDGMFETGQSVSDKIKQLFWISTYNFVFPVLLSIAQITIYIVNEANYLTALYIEEANFYLTIMGLVFATVWAAEGQWQDARCVKNAGAVQMSSVRFAAGGRELDGSEGGTQISQGPTQAMFTTMPPFWKVRE